MKQIDYPKLAPVAEMGPEEYLTAFFRDLGWDGNSQLDPTKVTISQQRWLDVCKEYNELPGPGIGGFFWMNYGPSASEEVPYHAVRIEHGAFKERDMEKIFAEDRDNVDKAVQNLFWVGEGNVIQLDADPSADNSLLLGKAYDYRHMTPEDYSQAMRMDIAEDWAEAIDLNADYVLQEAGIRPSDMERFEAARDYLFDNYEIRPPYDELLGREAKVNILLGTPVEADLDFSSIHDMLLNINEPGAADEEVCDNALSWMAGQQGYDYDSLADAVSCQQERGFSAALDLFGPFLASAASELNNFPNVMGTIAVLTRIPLEDIPKLSAPDHQITVPENTTVGIFAPWVGGGSMLNIELEKPLVIPTEMVFETQVEGVRCDAYTVNQVYGLVDDAWKRPLGLTAADRDRDRPLGDLVREAKEKAAEKSITRQRHPHIHKPPGLER